ncbi:MAG: histidine phosphatase family protein [Rhodocyclaceae bacterium]|nr:histidine phosphatase family protein [Rhodocyclaceae bacterium]
MRHRLLGMLFAMLAGAACADGSVALAELAVPGRVLVLRHASAPGFGDPPEFRIDDCGTQRNLDEGGRAQAGTLGARLRAAGIHRARVFSSQWCRCLETARLLDIGPVEALPALNSFYQRSDQRQDRLQALRAFLADQPVDGPPLVLVTHQVTISALTDRATPSGGGSLFALNGTDEPRWLGVIAPP